MRIHRDGHITAFRDDGAPIQRAMQFGTIAIVFALMAAIFVAGSTQAQRVIAGAIALCAVGAAWSLVGRTQHWCEIDHQTWTIRLIHGPWLEASSSTLWEEIQIRDVADVAVEQPPVGTDDDIGPYVVLRLRDGKAVRLQALRPRTSEPEARALADDLTRLIWPAGR